MPRVLTRRIIPCLDVKEDRVVKGRHFVDLRDAGDPAELAARYEAEGADEIVFLDITASHEGRPTRFQWVERVAEMLFIPFTVGGGIGDLETARRLLLAGADKVSVNSAAVRRPALVEELARAFGSQAVVVAIDARRSGNGWEVCIEGGRRPTGLAAVEWAREAAGRGAGEILLTSIDTDGTTAGYDLDLLRAVARAVHVPVIASGGAGEPAHLAAALEAGADAALAASIFHFGRYTVGEVKRFLALRGIPVRPVTGGGSGHGGGTC